MNSNDQSNPSEMEEPLRVTAHLTFSSVIIIVTAPRSHRSEFSLPPTKARGSERQAPSLLGTVVLSSDFFLIYPIFLRLLVLL